MVAVLVFILLLFSASAQGATYWVRPTGTMSGCTASASAPGADSGYKSTLTAGISCLASGDTLNIRTGTYTEVLPQSTIPAGASWGSPTTLKAYDGALTVTLTGGGASPGHYDSNQSYIVWDGFLFDVATNFIVGNGAHHIKLVNFEIKNSADNGILVDTTATGTWLASGRIHNTGSNPSGPPHNIYSAATDVIYEDLEVDHSANGGGVHLFDSGSCCTNAIVRRVKAHDNATAGIIISRGANIRVYNNLSYNNGTHGIQVFGSLSAAKIYNNTTYGNASYGIIVDVASGAYGHTFQNNIAYNNTAGQILTSPDTTATADHNLTTDPSFVNAGSDFSLQSGSPAKDAGTDVSSSIGCTSGLTCLDIAGIIRPQNSVWDIGAYEYQVASTAATYYVATTGSNGNPGTLASPKLTIAAGIALLSSGDTLYIRAGTYNERFNVPSNVTIAGYPGELPLIKPTSGSSAIVNILSNTGFTLKNLEISGLGLTLADSCIGGSAPTNALLEDLTVHDCVRGPGGSDTTGVGLSLGGSGNTVRRMEAYNVDTSDTSSAGANGGYGIYSSGSNTIEYSYFHNNGGEGVQAYPAGGNTIRYNRFWHNGYSATTKSLGALTMGGSGNIAYGNVIWDNNWSGIDAISGCTSCLVYNNTIVNNGAPTNAFGLNVVNGGVTAINNILMNNAGGNIADQVGGQITASANLCFGAGGTTQCTITGSDPLFVNSSNDFHLQSGSPAKDTGTDVSSVLSCTGGSTCVDIVGTIRPQNSLWDIGAYEYQITAPPVTEMLVASYGFEENTGTTFADTSGQGNNGSFSTGVSWQATGKYGHALHFDGTGGATVADSSSLDVLTGFTLEAWVKPTSVTTDSVIINKNPDSNYYLFASLDGNGCTTDNPVGGFNGGGTACYATPLTTGVWSHLAVTYNSTLGVISLYLNGMLVSTVLATGGVNATTGTLQIGTSSFDEHFAGDIDEVRVYNYARTATQIVADMATPVVPDPLLVAGYGFGGVTSAVIDISPFNNNGTFGSGAARTSSKTGFGQALNFTAGTMTVPGSASLGNTSNGVTLEAWVNRNNSTASWQTVFGGPSYWMFVSSTGRCSEGAVSAGALIGSIVSNLCSGPIPSGTWVHLALTYDTATGAMKLYKDGVVVDSHIYGGTIDVSGSALLIGNSAVSEFCQCKIDDARVYNYALSQAAILTDMVTAISEGLPATPTGFRLK